MAVRFQLRRDTAANWTSANSVLALGEPGVETDTLKVKVGDGSTAWNSLAYSITKDFTDLTSTPTTLAGYGITDALALADLSITQNAASGTGAITYNNATGVFSYTPPNFEGLDGNFTGSVFADDSTIMVDGVAATLNFANNSIDDLPNVDITSVAPTNGQALIWNNSTSKFIPGDSFSQSDFNTAFGAKDTDALSEGSANLYYTDTRADARIALQAGANLDLSSKSTTNLTEGTNLYYTNARADARITAASIIDLSDADQSVQTTDDVTFANITTSGYLRGPASFVIDPAAFNDDTGTVVIAGNLQVDGLQTTINSTTVSIDDLNFSIATDAADSAAANGAGITIGGAGATLNYAHATTSWEMNKPLNITGDLGVSGTVGAITLSGAIAMGTNKITGMGDPAADQDAATKAYVDTRLNGSSNREVYTATAGQTTFSVTYDVGYVDVYVNGVKLAPADFTASNGTSIILTTGATVNDIVDIVAYHSFVLADHYTGTQSDARYVQVAGDTMTGALVVNTATNGLPSVSLSHSNTNADNFLITAGVPGTSNAGFSIRDVDAAANRLVIDTSGNVGIGTDAPARHLVLYGTAASTTSIQFQNADTGAAVGDGFGVGLDSAEKGFIWNYEGNDTYIGGAGGTSITVQNGGNVGIGETVPVAKLHIQGSGTSGQVSSSLILENSSSGTAGLQITGAAGSSHLDFMYAGGPGTGTNTLTTGLAMTLEGGTAGNVGIGTDDPKRPLQIGATNQFPISFNGNYPDIHFNTYYEGGWRVHSAGFGAKTTFNGATGDWVFSNAATTVSAGATFTPTDRFAILAEGTIVTGNHAVFSAGLSSGANTVKITTPQTLSGGNHWDQFTAIFTMSGVDGGLSGNTFTQWSQTWTGLSTWGGGTPVAIIGSAPSVTHATVSADYVQFDIATGYIPGNTMLRVEVLSHAMRTDCTVTIT